MTNEKMFSVESQSEYDVTSGKSETRIFVKMYVEAAKGGLIADMGAERWQTLCVIASFMDAQMQCYPTQDQIAKRLGVRRETANRRVKALCDYRWQGRQLVTKTRVRTPGGEGWDNNIYTIMPTSQLAIFDSDKDM